MLGYTECGAGLYGTGGRLYGTDGGLYGTGGGLYETGGGLYKTCTRFYANYTGFFGTEWNMELGFGNRVGWPLFGVFDLFYCTTIYSLRQWLLFGDFTFTFKIDSGRHILNKN